MVVPKKILMMKSWLGLMSLFLGAVACASDDSYRDAIRERIKPVGTIQVEAAKPTEPAAQAAKPKPKRLSGATIYGQYCSVCHEAGVAGAPRKANRADWEDRRQKGIAALVAQSKKGLNAMPASGTCLECDDEALKQAILYMLPKTGE